MTGGIPLDDFITHTMPLDEINTAFELMPRGQEHSVGDSLLETLTP